MDIYDTNQQTHSHKLSNRLRKFSKRFRLRLITHNELLMNEKINIYEKIIQELQQDVLDAHEKIQYITEAHQTLHSQMTQLQNKVCKIENTMIEQDVLKHKNACLDAIKAKFQPSQDEKQSWFTVKNVITL